MMGKVTGKNIETFESPRRLGDPARLVVSAEKIIAELGWASKYPHLETIIETTLMDMEIEA